MARIPVVGTKQLHTAQLSPEVRKILHHRAVKASRRAYAPELAADRAALAGINHEFQNEASSVRGAATMTEDMLAQALKGLKASGLSGRYLQQAVQELTSRQGDAAAGVPFLLSDARENRDQALGEARQELLMDRAHMQKSAAEKFDSLLKEERGAASSVLKEQADQRQSEMESQTPKFDPTHLANAKLALRNALKKWSENPTIEVNGEEIPLQQFNPLKTRDDYLRLAHELEKEYSGFDLHDVMHVIGSLLTDRKRHEHEGRLVQPGVPGPGRGA